MCMDFTDLNKACPKDHYPLPRIDQVVDRASGHQMLSFMDAFSRFNQIFMAEKDKEKTIFITESGIYHYNVMPFRLKNAGATYQQLDNKIFKNQVGRNIECTWMTCLSSPQKKPTTSRTWKKPSEFRVNIK